MESFIFISKLIAKSSLLQILMVLATQSLAGRLESEDWPALRGRTGQGVYLGSTALSTAKSSQLKTRWKKKIGSGYSSVIVVGDRCLTCYSDGEMDQVICLGVNDGKERWKYSMGKTHRGVNGSFDGPLSTPIAYQDSVYVLSPKGLLMALDLKSGKERWRRDLRSEEGAPLPGYGFSTSPIIADGFLCVLAGGSAGSLLAFDPATGATIWRAGTGTPASQTPVVYQNRDRQIIVTGSGNVVLGIDARSGKQRFSFPHGGSNGSAMMPVPFNSHQFLFTNDDSSSTAFALGPPDPSQPPGQFLVSESWTTKAIKNTYNVPVAMNGLLFAYSTRILTCIDQKTGKSLWKSRNPGDGFLIGVGDHLIVITKKGKLHIGKADAKGFSEIDSLQIFKNLSWSVPAFSRNAIFVRSLGEIACVELTTDHSEPLAAKRPKPVTGKQFGDFISQIEKTVEPSRKKELIDQFMKKQNSFPIIEGDVAHFVYRGKARDLALGCDVFGARQEEKMRRVGGTQFYYLPMALPPNQRISYVFLKDFQPILDPLNANSMTSSMYAGEMEFAIRLKNEKPLKMSWFGMPQWKKPNWFASSKTAALKGYIVPRTIALEKDGTFEIEVYLPPQYFEKKNPNRLFPVLYVFDGSAAVQLGRVHFHADQLFSSGEQPPAILVFLKKQPTRGLAGYLNQIANEVVPCVDAQFSTQPSRKGRALWGTGFSAGLAFSQLNQHPETFGGIAAQSPLIFDEARQAALNVLVKIKSKTHVYLDWGRFDMNNPVENWDIRQISKQMHREIKNHPPLILAGGVVNDSTDWGSWTTRLDQVLASMFP